MANASADTYAGKNYAIATVLFLRVLPALVMGPVAGWVADRLDRRVVLIWGDYVRGALFLTIPIVGEPVVGLRGHRARRVREPGVGSRQGRHRPQPRAAAPPRGGQPGQPRDDVRLGALPAAAIFAGLTLVDKLYRNLFDIFPGGPIDLALYFNAVTFVVSGIVIATLTHIPRGPADTLEESPWRVVVDGWKYVATTPLVRGLVIGIVGAFAAGGVVIGLARTSSPTSAAATPATASCSAPSSWASGSACGAGRGCCTASRGAACSASR